MKKIILFLGLLQICVLLCLLMSLLKPSKQTKQQTIEAEFISGTQSVSNTNLSTGEQNSLGSRKYSKTYHIAMGTDHRLVNQIQVSIVSAMLNAENDVQLNYHILVPQTLSQEDKEAIKVLERRFENCKINFRNSI